MIASALQLGHPANGVERPVPLRRRGGEDSTLQLGHPANGVESRKTDFGRWSPASRFNWATPRTGWKATGRGREVRASGALQLGHPANGVERSPNSKAALSPKSLQLGHPANGVESARRVRPRRRKPRRFNWATPRTGWKGVGGWRRDRPYDEASIGPPRERGGKPTTTIRPRRRYPGFNWATPRTGWKEEHQAEPRKFLGVLQLGHPANGVESSATVTNLNATNLLQLGHPANGVERRLAGRKERGEFAPASIGPPRERGGKLHRVRLGSDADRLQLGHPANGVERHGRVRAGRRRAEASIGPPRERGGKVDAGQAALQGNWGASIGPPRERGGKRPCRQP